MVIEPMKLYQNQPGTVKQDSVNNARQKATEILYPIIAGTSLE